MAPTRPRLIRRVPLMSRIQAYLNPWDILLSLSESLNSNEWEDTLQQWSIPLGIALNFIFMIARSNAGDRKTNRNDDVFGDYHARRGSGWLSWFCSFVVHFLIFLSTVNAIYTFTRKRHYRLFEASVNVQPSTPSARRVRVNDSPISSSPLGYLSRVLAATTAESRAHPDTARDVWELAIWDPTPLCLRIFTLFSPGHVLVYWLFLPLAPLDPRPSVTVATTLCLAALLSAQLSMLQVFFSQQSKDAALLQKEVQNEYDTKFVNPSLNRPVRDVGTQMLSERMANTMYEVDTYTPTTFVNRGFRTHPNTNYASFYDPDNASATPTQRRQGPSATPVLRSPDIFTEQASSFKSRDMATAIKQPSFRQSSTGTPSGDGGSLGVYSHNYSPLKRTSASTADSLRERSPMIRESSPLKRSSTPNGSVMRGDRFSHLRGDTPRRDGRY